MKQARCINTVKEKLSISEKTGIEVNYPTHFELRDKQADLNFIYGVKQICRLFKLTQERLWEASHNRSITP